MKESVSIPEIVKLILHGRKHKLRCRKKYVKATYLQLFIYSYTIISYFSVNVSIEIRNSLNIATQPRSILILLLGTFN